MVANPLDSQVGGGHYKKYKIQPVEYAMANNLNYCQANAVKYVTRYRDKGGVEDLRKAIHNLEILIELEERADNDKRNETVRASQTQGASSKQDASRLTNTKVPTTRHPRPQIEPA